MSAGTLAIDPVPRLGYVPSMQERSHEKGGAPSTVACWDIFEASFEAPVAVHPYLDVEFEATFHHANRAVRVEGFFDGRLGSPGNAQKTLFRLRFMPDATGNWSY